VRVRAKPRRCVRVCTPIAPRVSPGPMAADAPPAAPPAVRPGEGASIAIGLAAGLLAVAIAVWFRPAGFLAVAAVAAWLLWRRPRSAASGALAGAALPLITVTFWTSTAWTGFACALLLGSGLALALTAAPPAAAPRLGPAAAAPAGLIAGAFAGLVLVSSLFLVGYLVAQFAAALLLFRLFAWLNRRADQGTGLFHFAFAYGGLSVGAIGSQYQLHSYFSDAVDFALIKQLGGGSLKDALLFSKNEIAMGLAALAVFLLVWWACWRLARRFIGRGEAAPARPLGWRAVALAWLAFVGCLAAVPRTGSDAGQGLNRMLVWSGVQNLASVLTDFDRDGYGLFGMQTDDHPFDGRRHPLALDIPGNGIDEDGYAGDLRLVPVPAPRPETLVPGDGPNVVLVVLESTRADVLGKRIDGKPVAPNLEALAAEGAGIAPSFSHVAFTTASLKSIFTGELAPRAGDPSLFRELKKSGYRTGVFPDSPRTSATFPPPSACARIPMSSSTRKS